MNHEMNPECIKAHENHQVRIGANEKDINKLGKKVDSKIFEIWERLDSLGDKINASIWKQFGFITVPILVASITTIAIIINTK